MHAQKLPEDLPDFSRAGYHAGDLEPPRLPPTVNLREFGAKPDDDKDDAPALRKAIAAVSAKGGVVRIPAGRWILRSEVVIEANGVVLQGEGAGKTVLFCPHSMTDLHGPSPAWSFGGWMIQARPRGGAAVPVARAAAPVPAGVRRLAVRYEPGAAPPAAGERLELLWYNDTGKDTLLDHLYAGLVPPARMGEELRADRASRVNAWVIVTAAGPEFVEIDRPLPIDVRPEWTPTLVRSPHLREVGVEGMTIEFPPSEHPGHLKEKGYNALAFSSVIDGWVRDVEVVHSDSAVLFGRCRRTTATDILIRGRMMHHGLTVSKSSDCLLTRWRIEAPHVHGITITFNDFGNVYAKGWGRNLAMDAHRAAAFRNLITDIEIVRDPKAPDPLRSGGSAPRGPHAARENIYWNIRFEFPDDPKPVRFGPYDEWPAAVFAGWRGNRPIELEPAKGMNQQVLWLNEQPPVGDLYEYQKTHRR